MSAYPFLDEVIGMLKKKLQVMESFHCSSSSLDALNKHHHSSIFVLPEPFTPATEEFPSPKLKSFGMMTEAASGGGAGKRKRCYTDTGVLSLASEASPTLRNRRASLFDHVQRLRIPSFLKIKREEEEAEEKKKTGFFKRLLKQIKSKFQKKPTYNTQNREKNDSQASIASLKPHDVVELTYEQIISGQFGSLDISLDKVEVIQVKKLLCFLRFLLPIFRII